MGVDINLPVYQVPGGTDAQMYAPVVRPTASDLTSGEVGGTGIFDVLMKGMRAHLQEEYEASRITGAEYSRSYTELTQACLASSVQYALNRDASFWAAQQGQMNAVAARVEIETKRMGYDAVVFNYEQVLPVELQAKEAARDTALYSLNQMLPIERDTALYNLNQKLPLDREVVLFNLNQMMPEELLKLQSDRQTAEVQRDIAGFKLESMLPEELLKLRAERVTTETNRDIAYWNFAVTLPEAHELNLVQRGIANYNLSIMMPQQMNLVREQSNAQRAQTYDWRYDGEAVAGSIGRQKALYDQQMMAYRQDSRLKTLKIMSDAWITQKSIDEGLAPPLQFTNGAIDEALTALRTQVGLIPGWSA